MSATMSLPESTDHLYSAAEVARLFELPESRVRYWSQTGFIAPSVRDGNRRFYTFRDLIAVKVAKELLDAGPSDHVKLMRAWMERGERARSMRRSVGDALAAELIDAETAARTLKRYGYKD